MPSRYPRCLGRGLKGSNRVIRGGSWINNARNVRAAYRNHNAPSNRDNNLGFRLARAQPRAGVPATDPAGVPSVRGVSLAAGGEHLCGRRCADRAVDTVASARRRPVSFSLKTSKWAP